MMGRRWWVLFARANCGWNGLSGSSLLPPLICSMAGHVDYDDNVSVCLLGHVHICISVHLCVRSPVWLGWVSQSGL